MIGHSVPGLMLLDGRCGKHGTDGEIIDTYVCCSGGPRFLCEADVKFSWCPVSAEGS